MSAQSVVAAAPPPGFAVSEPTPRLPDGWEIADYTGRGGRTLFAVYFRGRRMASGMTTLPSAARWAQLLAARR